MMGPYREDGAAILRERARMLARLRELESRFTDVFWQELGPELGVSRRVGTEEPLRIEEDLGDIARRIHALEALLARWRAVERGWRKPRTSAPQGDGSRMGGADANAETVIVRERLEAMLRTARPRMPIDIRVQTKGALRVLWGIVTSAPRGAGAFSIEPERLLDDLRKVAGVLTDIDTGDDRFDGAFLIRGHESTVRGVLDSETRRCLLRLGARSSGVHATLGAGEASVFLYATPDRTLIDDALAVLKSMRRAKARPLRLDRPRQ